MTETLSEGSWEAVGSLGRRSDSSGGSSFGQLADNSEIAKSDELDGWQSHSEHLRLASIVKGVHADLRNKYKRTGESELERIWYEHCQNKPLLTQYADAMHHLAVDHWSKNQETRIDWCREVIIEFFKRDGLKKVLEKEKRRRELQQEKNESNKQLQDISSSKSHSVEQTVNSDSSVAKVDKMQSNIASDLENNNEVKSSSSWNEHIPQEQTDLSNGTSQFETEHDHLCHIENTGVLGAVSTCHRPEGDIDSADWMTRSAATGVDKKKQRKYNIVEVPVEGRIRLLDVGSCFNPFLEFPELQAVGIDISPATDSVFHCDFLHLRTTDPLEVAHDTMTTFINNLHNPIEWLPKECFHVVVFSLLLEYFPAPYQRWISCQKAHELLMYNGILVIVTPDSSHQNRNARMMKSWKVAIESIGFKRWRYVKQEHLHCMVFRKVAVSEEDKHESFMKGITPDMIYIPQDFNNVDEYYEGNASASAYGYEDEQFYKSYTLHELPVPSSDSEDEQSS